MAENEKQCKDCKYYAEKAGQCHLKPPYVVAVPASGPNVIVGPQSRWPTVSPIDWCGKFEPK